MTPDVNVLVAAFRRDHALHERGRAWLESALEACAAGQDSFVLLDMVIAGFVRVTTHPRAFQNPDRPEQAVGFIQKMLAWPAVESRSVEAWPLLLDKVLRLELTGNAIPDAWIAAAAEAAGERLVTFDSSFRRLLPDRYLTVL